MFRNEVGYLQGLRHILDEGVNVPSRSGGCLAVFGLDLEYDDFCLSTVRPAPLRMAFEELWFFLRGETNTKYLEEVGVNFWKGNTSREFLDARGLSYLREGELGSAYSSQWRNSGGYDTASSMMLGRSISAGGVDQLSLLINTLKEDIYSRRNLVVLWNPLEANLGAITPCWFASQWIVLPNKKGVDELHCQLFNRSNDYIFGATFCVQQYRLLQLALCKMFGLKLGKLRASISHAHIYDTQIPYARELVKRPLGKQGVVSINKEINSLEDLLNLEWGDIVVEGLEVNRAPFVSPRPEMAV